MLPPSIKVDGVHPGGLKQLATQHAVVFKDKIYQFMVLQVLSESTTPSWVFSVVEHTRRNIVCVSEETSEMYVSDFQDSAGNQLLLIFICQLALGSLKEVPNDLPGQSIRRV